MTDVLPSDLSRSGQTTTKRYIFGRDIFRLVPSSGTLSTTGDVNIPSVLDGPMVFVRYAKLTVNAGHNLTTQNRCAGLVVISDTDIVVNGTIHMTTKGADITAKNMYSRLSVTFSTADPAEIARYEAAQGHLFFNPYVDLPIYLGIVATRVWDTTSTILQATNGGAASTGDGTAGPRGACGGGGGGGKMGEESGYCSGSAGTGVRGGSGGGGNTDPGEGTYCNARGPFGGNSANNNNGYGSSAGSGVYGGAGGSGSNNGAGGWLLLACRGAVSGSGYVISYGTAGVSPGGDSVAGGGSGAGCAQIFYGVTNGVTPGCVGGAAGTASYGSGYAGGAGYANSFSLSSISK